MSPSQHQLFFGRTKFSLLLSTTAVAVMDARGVIIGEIPNSQKAAQTRGSAPSKTAFRRALYIAQEDEGAPGRGSMTLGWRYCQMTAKLSLPLRIHIAHRCIMR